MKITMLGTGNALVTACYNTCFVLEDSGQYMLVDGGGGNGVLSQLKAAGLDWMNMRTIFVTHRHIDHLLGVVWMMRMITQHMASGAYEGEAVIFGHDEVIALLTELSGQLLQPKQAKYVGNRLHLKVLEDGQRFTAIENECVAFDIGSSKAKQFGFSMSYDGGRKLTCCGDEPYNDRERPYAEGADWLLHEAFCLYDEADEFKPYEKHHSTVKDACELAERLGVLNLLLYHTEDKNIRNRKMLYGCEGRQYFGGNLHIPDDLECIEL